MTYKADCISLLRKQWVFSTDVPDVTPSTNDTQLYFEMLNIQPIGFDLSFVRTNQADNEDENSALARLDTGYNPVVDYALNVVTMALGNINVIMKRSNTEDNMLICLYAINREHHFDSMLWRLRICEPVHPILPIVSRFTTVINLSINITESLAQLTF